MKRHKLRRNREAYSPCRELVLVDSTGIKLEEQQKCQKLYKKLETTRQEIELHESESVPEFKKWLHSHFGKELTEIREMSYNYEELKTLVEAVESQSSL